jgi:hypothetical protein
MSSDTPSESGLMQKTPIVGRIIKLPPEVPSKPQLSTAEYLTRALGRTEIAPAHIIDGQFPRGCGSSHPRWENKV